LERCSIVGPDRENTVRLTERPAPRVEAVSIDGAIFADDIPSTDR
jgi:hypothetical protein